MKMKLLKLTVMSVGAVLTVMTAGANDKAEKGDTSTSEQAGKVKTAMRFSELKDAKISEAGGDELGKLQDLVINPQTGKIEFAVMTLGGDRLIPIPWNAVKVQPQKQFTLNIDREKLQSAPSLDNTWSSLADPGQTITIYRFFAVPDIGAAESPGATIQGEGETSKPDESLSTAPDKDESSMSSDKDSDDDASSAAKSNADDDTGKQDSDKDSGSSEK